MRKIVLGSLLLTFVSCKQRGSDLLQHEGQPTKPLTAEDVSILVPLSFSAAKDRVLGVDGDGFCNAPTLANEQGNHLPIVSEKLFKRFAKRVFGGETDNCPLRELSAIEDTVLINAQRHAALLKGLRGEVCNYSNWRIVGFRFDPCANRSDVKKRPNREILESKKCSKEARLVAQPFQKTGNRWIDSDVALHLLFDVPDIAALIADMKALQNIREQVLNKTDIDLDRMDLTRAQMQEFQANPDRKNYLHRPHSAMRVEMPNCNSGGSSVFSDAFKKFLGKHTNQSKLNGIAWMTSDTSPSLWSFSSENVKDGRLVVDIVREMRAEAFEQINIGKVPQRLIDIRDRVSNYDEVVEKIKSKSLTPAEIQGLVAGLFGPDHGKETPCVDSFSNARFSEKSLSVNVNHILLPDKIKPGCGKFEKTNLSAWLDFKGEANQTKPEIFTRKKFDEDPDVKAARKERDRSKKAQLIKNIEAKFGHEIAKLNLITKPDFISQLGMESSNCVSCHVVDQTKDRLKIALRDTSYEGPEANLNPPPIWQHYLKPKRQFTNLRNFGYGPGFAFGVPKRTLFETEETQYILNNAYGTVPASAGFDQTSTAR